MLRLSGLVLLTAWLAGRAHAQDWIETARVEVAGRTVVVSARSRPGSDIKEVRGVGSFEQPAWVVKNVISDVARYQEFMPYTKESRVLFRGDGFLVSYQRLSAPLIEDRDYTLRIVDESREDARGRVVWRDRWTQANHLGPPPIDGVTRVAVAEGYWQLEEDGEHTKATYSVFTNPGGSVPSFLVNLANAQAVPDLFRAVATAAADPRYARTRPVPRSSERRPAADPTTLAPAPPPPAAPPPPRFSP